MESPLIYLNLILKFLLVLYTDNQQEFEEHRRDFIYGEGKYKFAEHLMQINHGMRNVEQTITIAHAENDHANIKRPQELLRGNRSHRY